MHLKFDRSTCQNLKKSSHLWRKLKNSEQKNLIPTKENGTIRNRMSSQCELCTYTQPGTFSHKDSWTLCCFEYLCSILQEFLSQVKYTVNTACRYDSRVSLTMMNKQSFSYTMDVLLPEAIIISTEVWQHGLPMGKTIYRFVISFCRCEEKGWKWFTSNKDFITGLLQAMQ